jgi:hypothetical protein
MIRTYAICKDNSGFEDMLAAPKEEDMQWVRDYMKDSNRDQNACHLLPNGVYKVLGQQNNSIKVYTTKGEERWFGEMHFELIL